MAAPLLRAFFHNYKRFTIGAVASPHRPWCSAAINPPPDKPNDKVNSVNNTLNPRSNEFPSSYLRLDDGPDYRKWKDKEDEILTDIEPIVLLTKEILHSER